MSRMCTTHDFERSKLTKSSLRQKHWAELDTLVVYFHLQISQSLKSISTL
jgi:hypothetical protein